MPPSRELNKALTRGRSVEHRNSVTIMCRMSLTPILIRRAVCASRLLLVATLYVFCAVMLRALEAAYARLGT